VFLLLRSIIPELVEHPNLSILAVIKTHLMCLQDMFYVSVDVPNLSDMSSNLSVLIESKESSLLKLKQLEDRAITLEFEFDAVRQQIDQEKKALSGLSKELTNSHAKREFASAAQLIENQVSTLEFGF